MGDHQNNYINVMLIVKDLVVQMFVICTHNYTNTRVLCPSSYLSDYQGSLSLQHHSYTRLWSAIISISVICVQINAFYFYFIFLPFLSCSLLPHIALALSHCSTCLSRRLHIHTKGSPNFPRLPFAI